MIGSLRGNEACIRNAPVMGVDPSFVEFAITTGSAASRAAKDRVVEAIHHRERAPLLVTIWLMKGALRTWHARFDAAATTSDLARAVAQATAR